MTEQELRTRDVDEYIASFPEELQERMKAIRKMIHANSDKITEKINWRMPTFVLNGNLIHFAGYKNHIGIYPGESGVVFFNTLPESADFESSKGGIQFKNNLPLPIDLIEKIVQFRIEESLK